MKNANWLQERVKMNYKLVIAGWFILAISIIYWDSYRWKNKEPLSVCHNAQIKIYYDKPMCTECKLFCETTKERKK